MQKRAATEGRPYKGSSAIATIVGAALRGGPTFETIPFAALYESRNQASNHSD